MLADADAIQQRLTAGSPGMSADAACDLVALHLNAGNRHDAAQALQTALSHCPDHLESRLWKRLLAEPAHPTLQPTLQPVASQGWLSWERIQRRCSGTVWEAQSSSAAQHLFEAGLDRPQLHSIATYRQYPPASLCVKVELMLAQAIALRGINVETGPLLREAWMTGQRLPPASIKQLARVVIDLAVADPSAAQVGLAASEAMILIASGCPKLRARHACLMVASRVEGRRHALDALMVPMSPEDWRLLVTALAAAGHRTDAIHEAERALADPKLGAFAAALLMSLEAGTG